MLYPLARRSLTKGAFQKELSISEDRDRKLYVSELCDKVYARIRPKPDLQAVMALMFETQGDIKAEEIAEILSLNVRKVHNYLKRLRRIARMVRKELTDEDR